MALSDACFEFLHSISEAAAVLARDVHAWSDPDSAIKYGVEIEGLRRATLAVAESPYDPEAMGRLIRLANSVMQYHDTPPGVSESSQREAELRKLIRLLEDDLDGDDARSVPVLVRQVTTDTPFTGNAAKRLKGLLPKLGKSTYEIAVKILTDVASATAKKILGL